MRSARFFRAGSATQCGATTPAWCLDDGTLFHLSQGDYRLCAQERCLDWLLTSALDLDVTIVDETAEVAALAVQGPTSCAALRAMGLEGLESLKPFGLRHYPFDGGELMVSRTGFTGDLGYEVWVAPAYAEAPVGCHVCRRAQPPHPAHGQCRPGTRPH